MALNFRLQSNAGIDNDILFPRTSLTNIVGTDKAYEVVSLDVDIPATQEDVQTIAITTDAKMADANVRMYLKSTGEAAQSDYGTITQYEVKPNQLIIDRLYSKPKGNIVVTLVFFERSGA